MNLSNILDTIECILSRLYMPYRKDMVFLSALCHFGHPDIDILNTRSCNVTHYTPVLQLLNPTVTNSCN